MPKNEAGGSLRHELELRIRYGQCASTARRVPTHIEDRIVPDPAMLLHMVWRVVRYAG